VRTPPRILIVDDTPANVEILEMRLAANGYEILTAGDGEEALEVIEKQEPDLILLDIMMPRIDGIEVCRRVKANDALPFIPIVLVTSKADPKDVVAGLEAGAEEYLTKPVEHTALVARVKSMLRIKELHDQSQEQARRLEEQAEELVALNQGLEQRVAEQLTERR
jgi:DNA-binding response OmpR family regulator